MNIASIDRGIYVPVEVKVGSSLISIETESSLIKLNRSETEQLIEALQQAIKEEPKYVVILPQKASEVFWEYFYLADNGSICNSNKPYEVLEDGVMTLSEIRAFSEHYEPFAIPVEEFKQEEIGEF